MKLFKNKLGRDYYTFEELILLYNGFQRLLNNQMYFCDGLCNWITVVQYLNPFISEHTKNLLHAYLTKNKPSILVRYFSSYYDTGAYWWEVGVIKPRLEYIKKHMEKIKCEIERRSSILPLGPGIKLDDNGYYV